MVAFVDGVHLKNRVEVPPQQQNQHLWSHERAYDNKELSINYEMITPKSCHGVTTPMET